MKRAIILVIDSMGVGAMPDAPYYNDVLECNTLANVARFNNGLNLPNLGKLGLGNILDVQGVEPVENPLASYGKMQEVSKGKDTTTGHWEIAGLILDEPFQTYPKGFPTEVINEFIEQTGCKNILGNYPESGTKIIEDFAKEHEKTKFPIVYTSADSVFQIACDIDLIPLETLYKWCEIARELLKGEYNVSRVIARPYRKINGKYERISRDRRDYSLKPHKPTVLNHALAKKTRVLGIGKIEDIFVRSGISHAIHTGSNKEGLEITLKAIQDKFNYSDYFIEESFCQREFEAEIIFTNLVDTDMLFGHRNDPKGYGNALEEIDEYMKVVLESLKEDDLLIITADHGCDPTVCGTDHTREYVPVLVYNKSLEGRDLGLRGSFADIAKTVSSWLELNSDLPGESLL